MENTATTDFLDVTILEPRLKHPTIFEWFDRLQGGEGFTIHNDHDPKPLYYQLLAERGNIFKWEYLEQGPEVWEVRITKTTPAEGETVGELVAKDFRKAQVFKKYGIDFCCGGKRSLAQVCEQKGIDKAALEQELNALPDTKAGNETDYASWEPSFLADYIVNVHHKYVRESIPALYEFTSKIARVHGKRHPELLEIAKHFVNVANELEAHMPKEERVLFPYIKQLDEAKKKGEKVSPPPFGSIQNPINMMEMEHEAAGSELEAIKELTSNYTIPADACATYTVAFKKLQEFEEDLHRHIHLENNILFPKALDLEKTVLK
ncbi:regulator of cell morphogenesis and NO signaling [Pontibacter ummariensis]|uniref:Regulator of cell morphogenesis and NO signaling n=1 Tax=Pontibacter ummariensis TaxID=1610492 RepID=A0A239LTZ6_9BACT|nr:iron-sulfur cluster repair di-iron protein [Pontibacter ummariensis]PRY01226.1 regulator of cell morphogenesis and NO signaling [Pontibacter ummariensis]SNT33159.1 regulator of cell morphogenesis and NO signaling [Pontibacter ummariensis]